MRTRDRLNGDFQRARDLFLEVRTVYREARAAVEAFRPEFNRHRATWPAMPPSMDLLDALSDSE
jgi:hypothetical protein